MEEEFEAYRPLLFSIAYRMVGSASDAEDLVQETYLRASAAAGEEIRATKAYLSKIITNEYRMNNILITPPPPGEVGRGFESRSVPILPSTLYPLPSTFYIRDICHNTNLLLVSFTDGQFHSTGAGCTHPS